MSDDEPPVVPFGEILRRRRERSNLHPPKLPQEYESLEEYHEARVRRQSEPLQTRATRGYDDMKR